MWTVRQFNNEELIRYIADLHGFIRDNQQKLKDCVEEMKYEK